MRVFDLNFPRKPADATEQKNARAKQNKNIFYFYVKMEHKVMLNKWLYRRLPYCLRRRLTPNQSPFVLVVILACVVLFLQSMSMLLSDIQSENSDKAAKRTTVKKSFRRPLANVIGIEPSLMGHYVPDDKNRFICVASGKSIPFDWVNDDFCDCDEDGSDEPATGACKNGRFYCTLSHLKRQWIPSSRVNDGICDCCDGSDEWKLSQPLESTLSSREQAKIGKYQTPCLNICH